MKKLLFLLFTITSIISEAQDLSKGIDSMRRQLDTDMSSYDSIRKETESLMVINKKRFDSIEMARFNEQNSRNLDGLLRTMKERDQKQRQGMWLRLGFGILMLGVLIVGLLRKRKKKSIQ